MRILDNIIYRADKFNDAKVQYKLAVIYQTGDRVEPNPEEARRWFERAAEQGHEEAARALAGMGVEPEEFQARDDDEHVEAEELEAVLPPVIDPVAEEIAVDFRHDVSGSQDCPHGHGPLQNWEGDLRCWVCGWPEVHSVLNDGSTTRSATRQPESDVEAMRRKLGSMAAELFGKPPSAEARAGTPPGPRVQADGAAAQPAGPLSKVALMSSVLGVLGFITIGLTSLPAIILGYISQRQLKQGGPRHTADEFLTKMGLGAGWAGLVINARELIYFFMNLGR
jgi:hypothetical protein